MVKISAIEQLQKLLDCTLQIPEKDGAGIIIPSGIDAMIKAKTIQECLKIVKNSQIEEHNNGL